MTGNAVARLAAPPSSLVLVIAGVGNPVGLGNLVRGRAVVDSLTAAGVATHLVVRWYGGEELRPRVGPHLPRGTPVTHVSECEPLPVVVQGLKSAGIVPSLIMTDLPEAGEVPFGEIRRASDAVVVCLNAYGTVPADVDLCFLRGHRWIDGIMHDSRARSGARYEVVRERVLSLRPAAPWERENVDTVLIVLSAAHPKDLTLRISEAIAREVCQVVAVLGPLTKLAGAIPTRGPVPENVTLLHDPDDLPERMLYADIVVTLGGQTTYEAMALGRPVAVLRMDTNLRAADFFVTHDCVLDFGSEEEAPSALRSALRHPKGLRDLARRNWSALDGHGAERIVAEVLPLLPLPTSGGH